MSIRAPDAVASDFRPGVLLEALVRHKVRFVIVGGFAGAIHGAERPTHDLDICPAWYPTNLERLSAALMDLHATLRLRTDLEPTIVRPNPDLLRALSVTLWRTPAGNMDVLIGIADNPGNLACFPQLEARTTELQLTDGKLLVAALPDLIRANEVADRPKDREALPELRALLQAREYCGPTPAPELAPASAPHQLALRGRAWPHARNLPAPRRTPGLGFWG